MATFFCGGCWTIKPPDPAAISDPVPAFVADYGEHSAVLLPQSKGVYVEYSFGDWSYSVQNHDSDANAIRVLLASFQSSLGRTFTPMEEGENYPLTVRRPKRVSKIWVSKTKVDTVVKEMDDRYQAACRAKGDPVYNPENQAYFVKDRFHYSILNNCNHLTNRMVKKLGCKSSGIVYIADFTVKYPKDYPK